MARLFLILCVLSGPWAETAYGWSSAVGQVRADASPWVVSVESGTSKVQVFHEGRWTKVCGEDWDNRDAQVVCRMEGYWYGHGLAELRPLGPGDVTLLDHVTCAGNEDSLDQCAHQGWLPQSRPCELNQVAAVNCTPSGSVKVRLVSGYGPWEGRLEVEGDGGWRPVCHHGFDDLDAQVICRMLGLRNGGGKAHVEQKFPQSNLPPLIQRLDCTGDEVNLAHCKGKRAGAGGTNCTNVGVECFSCGGLYVTSQGTIQSDHYPLSYPGNLDCLYVIQPPTNQQQLYSLTFADFSTEACCDWLQVQVLDADSVFSGGKKYSGVLHSPPRFLGKAFALTFTTDGSHAMQGFRATWAPAGIQDVTTVTCSSGHFRVEVNLSLLKRMYPASNASSIALADPKCQGHLVTKTTSVPNNATQGQKVTQYLVIESPVEACGSRVESRGSSSIIYHNFLVDRVFAADSSLIVRQRRWELPLQCTVNTTQNFQIHYNPVPHLPRRKREAEAEMATAADHDADAHARQEREVHGSVTASSSFNISIRAYQDRTFAVREFPPLSRRLGDDLDLRVEMTGGDLDLKLVLQNCSAQPENGSELRYDLIQTGCAVDSHTEILHSRRNSTDFRFTVFEFAGDYPHVTLFCDFRVCQVNENTPECTTQQCGGGGGAASSSLVGRKRSLSGSQQERMVVYHQRYGRGEQSRVRFGPIVLRK